MPARVISLATQRSTIVQAAVTAAIVGPILLVINQTDTFLAGGEIPLWKVILTVATPYVVATIGNVNAKIRFAREAAAGARTSS